MATIIAIAGLLATSVDYNLTLHLGINVAQYHVYYTIASVT